jgi:ornithine cyclodeaminase/alanine dehydrogenase-like protein (mu-crystallin family)
MTPDQQARLKACIREAASILYEAREQEMQTLEEIERTVREQVLKEVAPEIGNFLSSKSRKRSKGERGRSKAASES